MLFGKECKKTICSLTFILYVATVIVMYISQFRVELKTPIARPQPNQTYGSIEKEIPQLLMPAATESLMEEYLEGSYTAYPFGFYKSVTLKESDSIKMAQILEELTGIDKDELNDFMECRIAESLTYERFQELMTQADKIIGGGSKYGKEYLLSNFSAVPMTYEEALEEYEIISDEENIAESYTRLYCDYMGIVLGIIPVFVCAGFWQADKKSRMEQLIYSRKISSAKLVLTRYLAIICCMLIPVVLTFLHALLGVYKLYPEKNILFGKAAGLMVMWILPEMMAVSGIGAFLSELISPFLAIFVQCVWWYMSIGANKLTGSITKYTLIIRHNNLGRPVLFEAQMDNFIQNRISYMLLTLVTLLFLVLAYDRKRRGGMFNGSICKSKIVWKHNSHKYET